MTENHLQVLAKAHCVELLEALAEAPHGLSWKEIDYDVLQSSSTAKNLLDALQETGLVAKVDSRYVLTRSGMQALDFAKGIIGIQAPQETDIPLPNQEKEGRVRVE